MIVARKPVNFIFMLMLAALLIIPLNCAKSNSSPAVEEQVAENVASPEPVEAAVIAKAEPEQKKPESKTPSTPSVPDVLKLHGLPPNLDLFTETGSTLDNTDFKGKPYIVTFWAPKCDVCITQMKLLVDELAARKLDVPVIAISPGETREDKIKEAAILKDKGIKAVIAFDNEYKTVAAYRLTGVPYFALVDAKNRLMAAGGHLPMEKISSNTFIDLVALVAAGGVTPPCEFAPTETPERFQSLIGTQAPVIKGKTLDGKDESTEFYRNFSRLLVVFWSPMCPHCRAELPRLESFYREHGAEKNINILGFVAYPEVDEDGKFSEALKQLLPSMGVTFPNIPDYAGKFQELYSVRGVPAMFIIGKDGTIEQAFAGEFLFTSEGLVCNIDRIDEAAKGK